MAGPFKSQKIEYEVISEMNLRELAHRVNNRLAVKEPDSVGAYELQGGIAVAYDAQHGLIFAQALIKRTLQ